MKKKLLIRLGLLLSTNLYGASTDIGNFNYTMGDLNNAFTIGNKNYILINHPLICQIYGGTKQKNFIACKSNNYANCIVNNNIIINAELENENSKICIVPHAKIEFNSTNLNINNVSCSSGKPIYIEVCHIKPTKNCENNYLGGDFTSAELRAKCSVCSRQINKEWKFKEQSCDYK